jgi:type IV secretion system protein VirB4
MARSLILSDGGPLLKPEEERRLDLALRIVMEMPPSIRSWNEVRAFLGTDEAGPGARLRRWCKGFEYGWVLDNDNNLVDLGSSQISGIDQTHYLKHPIVCGPIQAELFYQAQKLSKDGMPTIWAIDECWQSFLNEVFRGRINDAIKTGIKQGISMWLSTQSPRDAISTDIGHTIKEQCITQFSFANASADWNDFGEGGLGYPRRAFEWIKSELPKSGGKGRFLLKQGEQYTPCKFDMGGPELENYRTELSGTTITVNLFDHVLQEVGDEDMDEAFRVFHQRRKEPTFLRKVRRHEQEMEAV